MIVSPSYSFLLSGGKYKQNNTISFYSDIGTNTNIIHLMGTSEINYRFSSNYNVIYYQGATVKGGFQILPKGRGWIGGVDYDFFVFTKELEQNINYPVEKMYDHSLTFRFGHVFPHIRLFLYGNLAWRKGISYVYGIAKDNKFELYTTYNNYLENQWRIGLNQQYVIHLKKGKFVPKADLSYFGKAFAEESSSVIFTDLAKELKSNQINLVASLSYFYKINKKIEWFVEPSGDFNYYISTKHNGWGVYLTTGISIL